MSALQKSIADKRRQQRQLMIKRLLIVVLSVIMLVTAIGFFIWYDRSKYSKVKQIEIVGNRYTTKSEIVEDLELSIGDKIYTLWPSSVEKKLDSKSLIKTVKVHRRLFEQSLKVVVEEKPIIAYTVLNDQQFKVFSTDTSSKIYNNDAKDLKSDLIYLNVNDSELSNDIIRALADIDPVIRKSISEVNIKPISYDSTQIQLTMSGGYFILSSLNGLDTFKASYYQEIINQLQSDPDLKCLEVDKFIGTVRAYRCPWIETETPMIETDNH